MFGGTITYLEYNRGETVETQKGCVIVFLSLTSVLRLLREISRQLIFSALEGY